MNAKQKLSQFIKNRSIVVSVAIFQFLVIWDAITVLYVVMIESDVFFVNAFSFAQGMIAVLIAALVTLIINFVLIGLSFSRLRTTTVAVPLVIANILFWYFIIASAGLLAGLGPIFLGLIIGVYYAIFFYGPAIWFYFRFRLPHMAVGWISILYLTTLLIARALQIDAGGLEQATALLRADILILAGVFYFAAMMLFVTDNTLALARWKRSPGRPVKLPVLKTTIPVILLLLLLTVLSNAISPSLWKVLWERAQGTEDKISEEDLPDTDDGPGGNLDESEKPVKMNPNEGLQDEISEGKGSILFTVKSNPDISLSDDAPIWFSNPLHRPISKPHYWKMENLDSFSDKRGFYNDFEYSETYSHSLHFNSWLSTFDYPFVDIEYALPISQIITMYDFETNWFIGREQQMQARILAGKERNYYIFENATAVTQKNKPWTKGDSYEIHSIVSTLDLDSSADADRLRCVDDREYCEEYNSYFDYYYENSSECYYCDEYEEIAEGNNEFDDSEIEALAEELTGEYTNRFDKAMAIQRYLMQNYEYSLEPGNPDDLGANTEGIDRLKYFLFEEKEGYCLYFASAMTAMLRSQNVPARVAGGFAEGYYNDDLKSYIVTSGEAHAWVEIYFDEYGWITFDPTPPSDEDDEEKEEKMEENMTKEVEEEIKDFHKDAKETYDKYINDEVVVDPPDPFEPPGWFDKLSEQMAIVALLLKYGSIPCCLFALIFALTAPPAANIYKNMSLMGKFKDRPDREQIIAYFKLIQRKMRKWDSHWQRRPTETSLQYYKRLNKQNLLPDRIKEEFKTACEIYNRAAFRHELLEKDRENMHNSTVAIIDWIDGNMTLSRKIVELWWK